MRDKDKVAFLMLDVNFDDEAWVFSLPSEGELAWIKLQCYVKAIGRKGRAPILAPMVAARKWRVGEENVVKMLAAAETAGRLAIDGDSWAILGQDDKFRSESASRVAKHRAGTKEPEQEAVTSNVTGEDVTLRNVTSEDVTEKTECNVTLSRESQRDRESSVPSGTGEDAASPPAVPSVDEPFGEVEDVLKRVHAARDWPPPRRQDVTKHLKADSPLRLLVAEFGREKTAAMFVWTHDAWKGKTSWPALFDQRYAVRDGMGGKTSTNLSSATEWRTAKRPKDGLHFHMPGETDGSGRILKFVLGPPDWPIERRRTKLRFLPQVYDQCVANGGEWWAAMGLDLNEGGLAV